MYKEIDVSDQSNWIKAVQRKLDYETGLKKSEVMLPDTDSKDLYSWLDRMVALSGMKIGGEQPTGAKTVGYTLERKLYSTLAETINGYFNSLKGTETKPEVSNGLMSAIHAWREDNSRFIESSFEDLFKRGLVGGATSGGGKIGLNDKIAMEVLKDGKYRIGERIELFADDTVDKFSKIIEQSYSPEGTFDLKDMSDKMSREVQTERYKLERIVRTETSQVSNIGRLWSWNQDPDRYYYVYHWNSMPDSRRKSISRWRSEEGPYDYDGIEFLWLHQEEFRDGKWHADQYNQRCTISRSPIDEEFRQEGRFDGQKHRYKKTAEISL